MHFAALIALVVVVALSILASAVPVSSLYVSLELHEQAR
jgi:hypothetical protein